MLVYILIDPGYFYIFGMCEWLQFLLEKNAKFNVDPVSSIEIFWHLFF